MKNLIFLSILVLLHSANANDENDSSEKEINYRLSEHVIPYHYELEIKPYINENETDNNDQFTFEGKTTIWIKSKTSNVKEFSVNAKNLTINNAELKSVHEKYAKRILIELSEVDPETEKIDIKLSRPMIRGVDYILSFEFSGLINEDYVGLFKNNYTDENGNEKWLVATKFEPTYARKVFPCFDEPHLKATFIVKINRHNDLQSYSNTKINYSLPVEDEDRTIDVFQKTPVMPTYTLAFLVTDFEERHIEDDFTILVQPTKLNQTDVAFDNSLELFHALEEFTDIPYTSIGIDKIHFAALPKYAGAMENWGLVIFNEYSLLCNENCTEDQKAHIVKIMAHELSHMWFGNLVTCEWWSYLWLNEGFANFMEKYIVDKVRPELKVMENFAIDTMNSMFYLDAHKKYFPLTKKSVQSPKESQGMFTCLTYGKGSAVIRMFQHLLGEEKFHKAIQSYLKKYAFKSVTPDNLMTELNKEWRNSDIDFATIFSDWTEQAGYPLVTIHMDADGKSFSVTQKQYHADENEVKTADRRWTIPIAYTTDVENDFENTLPDIILEKNKKMKVALGHKTEWIIANVQRTGFYQVNYDTKTWQKIEKALKEPNFSGIHVINRAQIASNLLEYASKGLVDYTDSLRILEFLKEETDSVLWGELLDSFVRLGQFLNDEDFDLFSLYMKSLLTKEYDEEKSNLEKGHWYYVQLNQAACAFGVESCIEKALEKIEETLKDTKDSDAWQIAVVMKADPEKYFEMIFEQIKKAPEPEYPSRLSYLASIRDSEKLLEVFKYALKMAKGRKAFFLYVLWNGRTDYKLLFNFVVDNFQDIMKDDAPEYYTRYLLSNLGRTITTEIEFEKYEELLKENKEHLGENADENIENYLISARQYLTWHQNYYPSLTKYLQKYRSQLPEDKKKKTSSIRKWSDIFAAGKNVTLTETFMILKQSVINVFN